MATGEYTLHTASYTMSTHAPISYVIGCQQVTVFPGTGLNRVITDFDTKGQLEVLTVVTAEGAWRVFSDGSTLGDLPHCVKTPDTWVSETPTKPDIPSVHPKKPV